MKTNFATQVSEGFTKATGEIIAKVEEMSDGRVVATAESAEVLEHWYTLVPREQFSVQEFYKSVEEEIKVQQVPALAITRVDFSEGGLLSDKREYLRMQRERLYFDVCAAPVGINFFFSYRFYQVLPTVKPWEVIILLVFLLLFFTLSIRVLGIFAGSMLPIACSIFMFWTMRNAIALGLRDLDATLIKSPILGSIYMRYFRKDTYYRQDMRIAYCSIVSAIIKTQVETITAAKGVKLIREYLHSPAFDDLYKVKQTMPREKGKEEDA